MEFLSNVSPKLGWIITIGVVLLFIYVGINNMRSNAKDEQTKINGIDLKAEIITIKFDEYQQVNNHLTAAVTVKYNLNGRSVIAKRGISFPFIEKEKFIPGSIVDVRVDKTTGDNFYFINYTTF